MTQDPDPVRAALADLAAAVGLFEQAVDDLDREAARAGQADPALPLVVSQGSDLRAAVDRQLSALEAVNAASARLAAARGD